MQATSAKPAASEQPSQGYVLDEQGQEHPITEAMIQQACRELEQALSQAMQPPPRLKTLKTAP